MKIDFQLHPLQSSAYDRFQWSMHLQFINMMWNTPRKHLSDSVDVWIPQNEEIIVISDAVIILFT